ncbi:MAG: VOC family protein [Polyangiaceae bacterium]
MKATPIGWPRVTSAVYYDDAAAAIDWLCRVFGFETRLRIEGENGQIVHSELEIGDGLIMVSQAGKPTESRAPLPSASPRSTQGVNTQSLCVFVDDADAHCARVRAAGGTIVDEPSTQDYGDDYWVDRTYRALDLEGHHWWFMQRVTGGLVDEKQ